MTRPPEAEPRLKRTFCIKSYGRNGLTGSGRLTKYSRWKKNYQAVYEKFIIRCLNVAPSTANVKIAVLDTGIDLNHPDMQACSENIKAKYNCLNGKAKGAVHDLDGHGTFVASLLLDYAPDAEIYVVKIADRKPSSPRIIAKVFNVLPSSLLCFSTFIAGSLT